MTGQLLKSTTALALCLSMAMPAPIQAQTTDGDQPTAEQIEEMQRKLLEEQAAEEAQGAQEVPAETTEETPPPETETESAPLTEAPEASEEQPPEMEAEEETPPAAEPAPAEEAAPEAAPEAEAVPEPAPEADATEEIPPAPEAAPEVTPEAAEPAPEADAGAEAETPAEAPTVWDTAPETEAQETEMPEADTPAATASETEAQPSDSSAEAGVWPTEETDAPADAPAAEEEQPTSDPEQSTETDSSETAPADTEEEPATTDAESDASALEQALEEQQQNPDTGDAETSDADTGDAETGGADPAAELPEVDSQTQADQAAEQQESTTPAAAATAETEGSDAEVTTETVTEETARSSDEEFETTTSGEANATAKKDKGLSNFEKAALVGLGALAVGAILKNGDKVVSNTGDRVVVERDGQYRVLKNDDALLRRPGSEVRTETFNDGSTRTTVTRDDGTKVVTVRSAAGRVLQRTRTMPNGERVTLFDDTREVERVDVSTLRPVERTQAYNSTNAEDLERALLATRGQDIGRTFSLGQIRSIDAVRHLVPEIAVDNVTFETGSAVIRPEQARQLATLGGAMRKAIERNPAAVFLVEGHTDAVGRADYNLSLSDRRAETLALALSEYFDVPPENMVVQGYGESDLKVRTSGNSRENRRVAVRPITSLLN